MVIKPKTKIIKREEVKRMKKSKIAIALVLSLLLIVQSFSAFAAMTINLGDYDVDLGKITGSTLVTDQPAVGQSVYYDINFSDGSPSLHAVGEYEHWPLLSVTDSVYTYGLNEFIFSSDIGKNISITAKVYDSSIGFTGVEATKDYIFNTPTPAQPHLYDVWMTTTYDEVYDEVYGKIYDVRDTIYGYVYENNARISMPFNTLADDYEIFFDYFGDKIYVNGQDLAVNDEVYLNTSENPNKCEPVSVSVYRSVYHEDYNLDVYLNTPGTATIGDIYIDYPTSSIGQPSPTNISGLVSDADSGNVGINVVYYTLQDSAGNYFDYDFASETFSVSSSVYAVYNDAYLNWYISDADFTRYWNIDFDSEYKLPDSTYTLTVFADDGKAGTAKSTTFTVNSLPPVNPGTGGSTPNTPVLTEPTVELDGTVKVPPTKLDDKGNSVIPLTLATLKKAIEQAKAGEDGGKIIKIELSKVEGAKAYLPEFPVELLTSADNTKFEISTEFGTVLIPANMLKGTDLKGAQKVSLSISLADTSDLSDELKKKLDKKPIIDLGIIVDGNELSWSNSSAPVTVTVPYTVTKDEAKNPEFLTVWYIDGKGKAVPVPSARYNKNLKAVTFTTTHFSSYALVYNETTFSDISKSFAKKSIQVLAAKGIVSGIGNNQFSPVSNITRADFLVMLVKALGLNAEFDKNFSDVESSAYFYNAVGIAKKLGIVSGTGNNIFNPNANITRQDMMVMAAKAMKAADLSLSSDADLSKFADASSIASYATDSISALVSNGIVSGSGDSIMPKGTATREQVASIIYKIYNK